MINPKLITKKLLVYCLLCLVFLACSENNENSLAEENTINSDTSSLKETFIGKIRSESEVFLYSSTYGVYDDNFERINSFSICPSSTSIAIETLKETRAQIVGYFEPDSCFNIVSIEKSCELVYEIDEEVEEKIHGYWVFLGFLENEKLVYPPCKSAKLPNLRLSDSKRENSEFLVCDGTATINWYSGSYSLLEENKIKFEGWFRYFVGGSEEATAYENRYWQNLKTMDSYELNHNLLSFSNEDSPTKMIFLRQYEGGLEYQYLASF
ncbi:MAG: hypothetical protein AAFU57_13165 [Bacteroidota bacterium]